MSKHTREREAKKQSRRMWRRVAIWCLAIAALAGITFLIYKASSSPSNQSDSAFLAPAISDKDWQEGNKTSKVTLIEYGDYECPACGSYYNTVLKQLVNEYKDRILFVFRNFPLQQHVSAKPAAYAAEAAGLQGKYWEMNDLLYTHQNDWALQPGTEQQTFESYASQLGLDINRFKNDMKSDAVQAKVDSDYNTGIGINIDHTPTFFVNLKQIANPLNYDDFKSVLDQALAGN